MTALKWAGALGALQVLDLATTWWAIDNGASEGNPVVSAIGWPLAAAAKLGIVTLIALGAKRYSERWTLVLAFVALLYGAIVLNNSIVAIKGAA